VVAWFTDRDLFDVLCRQVGRGLLYVYGVLCVGGIRRCQE